jgi:hypothetical protein
VGDGGDDVELEVADADVALPAVVARLVAEVDDAVGVELEVHAASTAPSPEPAAAPNTARRVGRAGLIAMSSRASRRR